MAACYDQDSEGQGTFWFAGTDAPDGSGSASKESTERMFAKFEASFNRALVQEAELEELSRSPKRALFAESARITSLCAVQRADEHVKARWEMLFAGKGGERESVVDEVFYLVCTTGVEPRILSYTTADGLEVFREQGLRRSA